MQSWLLFNPQMPFIRLAFYTRFQKAGDEGAKLFSEGRLFQNMASEQPIQQLQ